MMDRKKWLENLIAAAGQIASREFQERSWFGKGSEISSPEELYCDIFDDFTAELFYDKFAHTFTGAQLSHWHDFMETLKQYGKDMGDNPNPSSVLEDPGWERVRKSAAGFVQAFTPVER